jgi:hypothetical protein
VHNNLNFPFFSLPLHMGQRWIVPLNTCFLI